jgi:excisionase family DNA binding protein
VKDTDPARAGDLLLDALADRVADRILARMPQQVERQSYSINEAAESLGISRATIERLIAADQIVAQRVGARRTITAAEVRRFAREGGAL